VAIPRQSIYGYKSFYALSTGLTEINKEQVTGRMTFVKMVPLFCLKKNPLSKLTGTDISFDPKWNVIIKTGSPLQYE
jgi:hypothetical protein